MNNKTTLKKLYDEYSPFLIIFVAILTLFLVAAYFAPTPREKLSYLQYFFMTLATIYVTATLLVFVVLGFRSFAYYMAIFLAMVIYLGGVYVASMVIFMTYVAWGFVFGIEALLVYYDVQSAKDWFLKRYTLKSFKREYKVFYPAIVFLYFMLEYLPAILKGKKITKFQPRVILSTMENVLGLKK